MGRDLEIVAIAPKQVMMVKILSKVGGLPLQQVLFVSVLVCKL